jgi:hypothetical protein
MAKRWEYQVVQVVNQSGLAMVKTGEGDHVSLQIELNRLGQDNWSLVAAVQLAANAAVFTLKRPLAEQKPIGKTKAFAV